MYSIRHTNSLLVLFLLDFTTLNAHVLATAPVNDYQKQLMQAAKMNRLFQLPNAQVLNQAISPLMMDYFLEKTRLIEKIADRQLKEAGIYLAVDLACYDYGKYLKENTSLSMLEGTFISEEMKILLIDAIIANSLIL